MYNGYPYFYPYLWRNPMPEREVCSPVSRKGSKVGSGQPLSPGAFSNPSRVGGPRFDSVSGRPSHARVSLSEEGQPAEVTIVGPSPED
jgi:hypothetical protein